MPKELLFVIIPFLMFSCGSDNNEKLIDQTKKKLLIPKGTSDMNDKVVGCWETDGEEIGSGRAPIRTYLFDRLNFYSDGTMDDMTFTRTGIGTQSEPFTYKRKYNIIGNTIYMTSLGSNGTQSGEKLPNHRISVSGNSLVLINTEYKKCDCFE